MDILVFECVLAVSQQVFFKRAGRRPCVRKQFDFGTRFLNDFGASGDDETFAVGRTSGWGGGTGDGRKNRDGNDPKKSLAPGPDGTQKRRKTDPGDLLRRVKRF